MLGRVVSHESNGAKVTIIRNDRRGLGSSLACALRQEAINPVDGNCMFPDSQWSLWAGLPAMAASRSTNLLRLYPINCRSEHAREKPGVRIPASSLTSIASKLAPTRARRIGSLQCPVGFPAKVCPSGYRWLARGLTMIRCCGYAGPLNRRFQPRIRRRQ